MSRRRAKLAAPLSFAQAMEDPALFGPWFDAPSWVPWKVIAKAMDGTPLSPVELDLFRTVAGGRSAPAARVRELWPVCGRRGGKTLFASAKAVHAGAFIDYSPFLKPGERAVVMVVAADRDQAQVCFRYIEGFFDSIAMLGAMVTSRTKESIELVNQVVIQVQTCNFRRIRGRTVACAIFDEAALWFNDAESRNPDTEVLAAVRPAMLTIPGSLLMVISSPYARRGIVWDSYARYFGRNVPGVLVVQGDTETMNPSVDRAIIAAEYEKDSAAARAEYGARFRDDLETFVSPEAVERVTIQNRAYLPVDTGTRYSAFVDPAGDSGQDSMAVAIACHKDGRAILCRLVEWRPPFSPDEATKECADILKEYRLTRVSGDQYAGDWPTDRFRAHGIHYVKAEHTKSDFYGAFLPLVNSRKVELLDHPRMLNQLLALERSTSRLGKDSIAHPPRGRDDLANAAAGALVQVAAEAARPGFALVWAVTKSTADVSRARRNPYMVQNPKGGFEYYYDPRGS